MEVSERGEVLVVRLDPGDELIDELEQLREDRGIEGAFFTGIGAVDEALLGHYDVDEQEYSEERFEGQFEVTNVTGNIGPDKVHAHMTLGRDDFSVLGGHCSSARVSGTFELLVMRTGVTLEHRQDDRTGLEVFDL